MQQLSTTETTVIELEMEVASTGEDTKKWQDFDKNGDGGEATIATMPTMALRLHWQQQW